MAGAAPIPTVYRHYKWSVVVVPGLLVSTHAVCSVFKGRS